MANLIEGLQSEIDRCQELCSVYHEIGPEGALGLLFISSAIARAKGSISSGDTIAMVVALKDLQDCA